MTQTRTKYPTTVRAVPQSPPKSGLLVLKVATSNGKLGSGGKTVQKGRFRGMPMYSLTLEERATCWSQCPNLDVCYGDNMPFAYRYEPGEALEQAVATDVARLHSKHPQGFVVRLHVLGDFYDEAYVDHWERMLQETPTLRLFGYTHWPADHPIGQAVAGLASRNATRVAFRRSDPSTTDDVLPGAFTIAKGDDAVSGTIICPEQTGKTASCTTCGLCMNSSTSISFIDHSRRALPMLVGAA